MSRTVAAVLGAAALTAFVAVGRLPQPDLSNDSACDDEVYGACVVYDRDAQRIPHERFEAMFRRAAAHWHTQPEALAGYTVVVKGRDAYLFAGETWIWGVTQLDVRRLDFAVPQPRCPELVFTHEWGHAGAHVFGHEDKRFADAAILKSLTEQGVTGCSVADAAETASVVSSSAARDIADTLPMATLTKWALGLVSSAVMALAAWTYAQERKVATLQAEVRDVQAYTTSIREDIRDIRTDIRSIREMLVTVSKP